MNHSKEPLAAMPFYLVLLHHPMMNRKGEKITTAVTNLDLHDIARSCRTYGVKQYFVVTPVEEQHVVLGRILGHWSEGHSKEWHPDRFEALEGIRAVRSFVEVKAEIIRQTGIAPEVIFTDARVYPDSVSLANYRTYLTAEREKWGRVPGIRPKLLVLGTGWGIHPDFLPETHTTLEPIQGPAWNGGYNHLSVRAAAAILLDRLFGT